MEFSCAMVLMENKMGWNDNDVNDEKEVSLERNWQPAFGSLQRWCKTGGLLLSAMTGGGSPVK